jgi:hypothetical protein
MLKFLKEVLREAKALENKLGTFRKRPTNKKLEIVS